MSESIIKEATKAIANVSNQKKGLISIGSTIGGLMAGGLISKGVSKSEQLSKYKIWLDTLLLAATAGAQFLPDKKFPGWAKQMSLGVGCYSVLSILSNLASNDKTPEVIKSFLVGYIPTIQNGTSLSGISIADMWAKETGIASSISETTSMQSTAPEVKGADEMPRPAFLSN